MSRRAELLDAWIKASEAESNERIVALDMDSSLLKRVLYRSMPLADGRLAHEAHAARYHEARRLSDVAKAAYYAEIGEPVPVPEAQPL